jgi:hypothetical protein
MKLSAFILIAQNVLEKSGDGEVAVIVDNPSMGPHARTEVTGVSAGFDWDAGRVFIGTKDPVLALPSENSPRTYEDATVKHCSQILGKPTVITVEAGSRGFDAHLFTKIVEGDILRIIKVGRKRTPEQIEAARQLRAGNKSPEAENNVI